MRWDQMEQEGKRCQICNHKPTELHNAPSAEAGGFPPILTWGGGGIMCNEFILGPEVMHFPSFWQAACFLTLLDLIARNCLV